MSPYITQKLGFCQKKTPESENLSFWKTAALEEEAAVRHHVIFVGLTSGPTDKAKHAVWECVVAAEKQGGAEKTRHVADRGLETNKKHTQGRGGLHLLKNPI